MAHIGADVPAKLFELTAVDAIFVRMGAKDNLMAGQSTFMIELGETAVGPSRRCSKCQMMEFNSRIDGLTRIEGHFEHFLPGPIRRHSDRHCWF